MIITDILLQISWYKTWIKGYKRATSPDHVYFHKNAACTLMHDF